MRVRKQRMHAELTFLCTHNSRRSHMGQLWAADAACPVVLGDALRVPIRYEDPKVADGTPQEAAVYDERCLQIATEMLYLFSRVASQS